MNRILIAYFSASGVTRRLADTLAAVTKGDLFEIKPAVPYTDADLDWTNDNSRSTQEMRDPTSRPPLAEPLPDLDAYDTIFVGFPIWWYVAPTIIQTFLEHYDLSGKTVIPFATSGGSGMGKTEQILKQSGSADTKWKPGKRFGSADMASVQAWVDTLDI